MAVDRNTDSQGSKREILNPGTWFFTSFILWSIIIVPFSIGAFYILNIFPRFTELGNQYSAVAGLAVGLIISAIVGYFYSARARKHME